MSTLVIEDLDELLMHDLVQLANVNRLSLEQQVKSLLRQSTPIRDRSKRMEIAERIAAMTPKDVPPSDTVAMLREDRDR